MRVVPFENEEQQRAAVPDVVEHLRTGGLILYPTETVFGFGGLIGEGPTGLLAELKSRDPAKPFILLISNLTQAAGLTWTTAARQLAGSFWPGPLTLILADDSARYPARIASETGGVAVRETPHPGIRLLLDALGEPLTSTSANPRGRAPARTQEEARALMLELPEDCNVWLLDGIAGDAQPSSVVDCTGPQPRLVRAGTVPLETILEVVHDVEG